MRELLLASCPMGLRVITAIQALIAILAWRRYARSEDKKNNILYLLTCLVAVGLFYDALILALGASVELPEAILPYSRLRFVFHGALIPLLFPICVYALGLGKRWKTAVWVFTGVLIAFGIAEGFATELVPQQVAGVVRYTSGDGTPGWAKAVSGVLSYGTVVPLILAGIVVWIRQKTPLLFLSGLLMFAFSALGPATGNFDLIFYISMFGEVCMVLCFLLYARKRETAQSSFLYTKVRKEP